MPRDSAAERPLPDCLTRFLTAPSAGPIAAPPGDRPGEAATRPKPRNRALQIMLVWAFAYHVLGFAILALLWRTMP
ncbi:hypothetical protein [Methylobacterium planeticum]|uniref:Uncharacterized protein n=1 Tax=Methylobacterium planeticum TaxID=2615211 RepID=A0A6N6MH79_9HYPH|nr:hypothetical protein [Methylobacterium planeticum]KAB1069223.1 hypothetical protein F6X51_25860 [Methylobacterium planeticum]